ncbi:hypothetical protein AGDE_13734 [Angomonas deanei]|nr:hypothetical protein AGDE_13734 [Angomonas deanei]|eukprot:EPY21806.1 hypothetical protein AGDE_13734 [Angomonas deanei]
MRSVPLPLQEVLRAEDARGFRDSHTPRSITLPVPDREAEAGYTALQADVLRYRANPRHATYQYNRDTPRTEGLLSVNASVMLKLCVPKRQANPPNPSQPVYLSPQEEHHCMIVSITDTVLTVEAPKAAATPSWLRQWLQRLHAGPTKEEEETSLRRNAFIYLWLHNLYIAVAVYVALPKVGLYRYYEVERRGARYTPSADLENREKARVALTIMYFVTLVFTHLYLPELWLLWWCSAWMMRLYAAFDTGVQGRRWGIILFAISAAWYYLSTA